MTEHAPLKQQSNPVTPLRLVMRRVLFVAVGALALGAINGCSADRNPGELSTGEQREVERIEDDPRTSITSIQRRSKSQIEVWTQQGSERRRYMITTDTEGVTRTKADLPGAPLSRNRPPTLPPGHQRREGD